MGRKRIKPEKISINIDDLCDLVNNKYKLKSNDIGSIEYHQDMCENSIVQIMNSSRGIRQLICGSEPVLRQFLQKILDDTVILYSL